MKYIPGKENREDDALSRINNIECNIGDIVSDIATVCIVAEKGNSTFIFIIYHLMFFVDCFNLGGHLWKKYAKNYI